MNGQARHVPSRGDDTSPVRSPEHATSVNATMLS